MAACLLWAAGCSLDPLDLEGAACDDAGRCAPGFFCNMQSGRCTREFIPPEPDGGGGPPDTINACGGQTPLSEPPGRPCGACGRFVCDSPDAVRCEDPGLNACGHCDTLPETPGTPCGDCGQWACDAERGVRCDQSGRNGCGGCMEFPADQILGERCNERCGRWACDGANAMLCRDAGQNACGGCGMLPPTLGEVCGECGEVVCDGEEAVKCVDPGRNVCGGCDTLTGNPGDRCGDQCGQLACNEEGVLACSDRAQNACGGCGELEGTPGDNCNACGTLQCNEMSSLGCVDPGANVCGGCVASEGMPGEACGDCGQRRCDGDGRDARVVCLDPGTNACGGCAPLDAAPGERCGVCGRNVCAADGETLECELPASAEQLSDDFEDQNASTAQWSGIGGVNLVTSCAGVCAEASSQSYLKLGDIASEELGVLQTTGALRLVGGCPGSLVVEFRWIAFDTAPGESGGVSLFSLKARRDDGSFSTLVTLPRGNQRADFEDVTPAAYASENWRSESLVLDDRFLHAAFGLRFETTDGETSVGLDDVRISAAVP